MTLLILESQYCIKSQISILSYPAFVTASRIEKKQNPSKKKKKQRKNTGPWAGEINRVIGLGWFNTVADGCTFDLTQVAKKKKMHITISLVYNNYIFNGGIQFFASDIQLTIQQYKTKLGRRFPLLTSLVL